MPDASGPAVSGPTVLAPASASVVPAKGVAATKAGSATPPEDWQTWLGDVRRTAVGLARDGRLVIYRKGKPVDPGDFRGVYRLGLPREE